MVLAGSACSSKSTIGSEGKSSVVTAASSIPSTAKSGARQEIAITAYGFSQLPPDSIGSSYVTYAVVVHNPNAPTDKSPWVATQVSLNITFTNAQGQVVDSQSPSVDVVVPGQSAATGDDIVQASGVTNMKVQANVGRWQQNDKPITGSFTTSDVTTTPEQYGGAKTVGTITSTFAKDYKQVNAVAVYEDGAGKIIGGSSTYVDFIPANGTASFSISATSLPPGLAKTVVYPTFSNLSFLSS
jgi:hypothetical protein